MPAKRWTAIAVMLAGVAVAEDLAQEPLDFFDFLGLMVEEDGELIDPVDMDFETVAGVSPELADEVVGEALTGDDDNETL
ncbi:MAG: hypothetical protein AAAFM81_15380 [Pseudomonadota bacterium]